MTWKAAENDTRNEAADFGRLVRERRSKLGWSQEALAAQALGNSDRKGYISAVENGRKISPASVKRIAVALRIARADIPPGLRWPEEVGDRELSPISGQPLKYAEIAAASPPERLRTVGSRITWERLLAGLYMPRPAALSKLMENFSLWKGTVADTLSRGEVPVFWIDGLSGDGKSVLLLQMAHALLAEAPDAPMFIARRPETVGSVLEFARGIFPPAKLVLVLVDDLHLTGDPDALERDLVALANEGTLRFALLACGPTPERRAFERLARDIHVTAATCPDISEEDAASFAAWFAIDDVGVVAGTPRILVELLFELKAGEPISAFARSFGERLRTRGLFEVVTAALAANVFDALAPIGLVRNARARAALEELSKRDQLHFELGIQESVEGFRLVHSRIAWRLFEEWSRGEYVEADIMPFLAESLAQVLRAVPAHAYSYFVALLESILTRLPLLFDLRQQQPDTWAAFILELLKHLETAPEACAVVARLALMALAAPSSSADRIVSIARSAREDGRASAIGRMGVAAALGRSRGVRQADRHLHIAAIDRMLGDPEFRPHGPPALMTLLSLPEFREDGIARSLEWLEEVQDAPAAQQLLSRLLPLTSGRSDVVDAALAWLGRVGLDRRTPAVLATLINVTHGREDVTALALEWLAGTGSEPRALSVLSSLVRTTGGRDDVVDAALKLLDAGDSKQGAQHALSALLTNSGNRQDVVATAIRWLDQVGTATGSEDVLRALIAATHGKEEVVKRAIAWLDAGVGAAGSQHVLAALLANMGDDDAINAEVIATALRWFDNERTQHGAEDVLRALIVVTEGRDDVTERILHWIGRHKRDPGAQHVLSALLANTFGREDVINTALEWLDDVATGEGSEEVLRSLIAATGGRDDVVSRALRWLQLVGVNTRSQLVLPALVARSGGRPDVRTAAVAWLDAAGTGLPTQNVLAPLISVTAGDPGIVERALARLRNATKGAIMLLRPLARHAGRNPAVIGEVERFLATESAVAPRIQVLTALIHGSGPDGAGIDLLLRGKHSIEAGAAPAADLTVFSASAANGVAQVIEACRARPGDARDLCFLISRASPRSSQTSLGEFLLSERAGWPAGCGSLLWRAIINDPKVEPADFWSDLLDWLVLRPWPDASEVARALARRSDLDLCLLDSLEPEVRATVLRLRETSGRRNSGVRPRTA